MKTTHTPGPWFAECMDEGQSGGYVYNASSRLEDDGRAICDMRPSVRLKHADKRRSDSFVYSQEDIANAQLIAAAPDLLAALEALLPFASTVAKTPFGAMNGVQDLIDEARAAIANAKGETAK